MFPSSLYHSLCQSFDISLLHSPSHLSCISYLFCFSAHCVKFVLLSNSPAHIRMHILTHIHNSPQITYLYYFLFRSHSHFLNPPLTINKDKQTYTEVLTYHNHVLPNWLCLDGILSLWKGVSDSGLMGEVLSGLQTELLATLKGVEVRSEKANLQETGETPVNHWPV